MGEIKPFPKIEKPFDKYNTPASPIMFPVGQRAVGWQQRTGAYQEDKSHKAIVRMNPRGDGAILLNIVGAGYKIVHNRELMTAIEDAMLDEMLPEHVADVRVTDRVAGWGRMCYREYVFPNIRCRIPNTRSDIGFRIIVQNGYGGSSLRIHAGAIDFYCTNGMIRGEYTSVYRRHTSRLVVGNLRSTIQDALLQFASGQDEWKRWAETRVTNDQVGIFFEEISTSSKMKEGLIDQFLKETDDRGANLWAVYSALTYYASHKDGAFTLRDSVEEADTVASTMLTRELNVSKWIKTKEWQAMEHMSV